MDFHFGSTPECVEFFKRNQTFHPLFDQLMMLTNDCFGREYIPEDRTERICFHLGETCRDDYLEILFLVVNGYGIGGAKLLRGLYERTVALAYTIKHREKAERFFRFAAIQEYKVLVAALEIVSEEQFNEAANGLNTVAEIKRRREEVVPEFQVEGCSTCLRKVTAFSWDVKDVKSQAIASVPSLLQLTYQLTLCQHCMCTPRLPLRCIGKE